MKKNKQKITLIVHNLSANPIARAYPIALALERIGYEIEIVGFLIEKNKVYQPYADKFNYKTVFIGNGGMLHYLKGLPKLLKLIDGDIIYTFKPRMTSFFVGLLKSRFGIKKELILDAEDDELFFTYRNHLHFLYYFFLRGWNNPNSHLKLLLLHLFLWPAKKRTVVSSKLKKKYGGIIIYHGPDENIYNPDLFDKTKSREEFNLPQDKKLILFAGVPHEHKGIRTIIEALERLNNDELALVCAGPPDHELFIEAKNRLRDNCIMLGMVDHNKIASLLAAVDITPILQKKMKFTESQMPAKLFEAMAMKKLIIATDASDIGLVIGQNDLNQRGFIIDYDDVDQLIELLNISIDNSELISKISENARNFYLKEASVGVLAQKLSALLK